MSSRLTRWYRCGHHLHWFIGSSVVIRSYFQGTSGPRLVGVKKCNSLEAYFLFIEWVSHVVHSWRFDVNGVFLYSGVFPHHVRRLAVAMGLMLSCDLVMRKQQRRTFVSFYFFSFFKRIVTASWNNNKLPVFWLWSPLQNRICKFSHFRSAFVSIE